MEALKASAVVKPDVAFLELCMADLRGAALARKLIAHIPGLKIVFVTAYAKELKKLKGSTASGSLLKPVSEAKLKELHRRLQG